MNCPCENTDEFQGITFCVDCGLETDDITFDEEKYVLGLPEKIKKVKKPTLNDLRKQAKELGLKGYTKLKKKELEALIEETIKIQKEETEKEKTIKIQKEETEKEKMLVYKNNVLTFFEKKSDDDSIFEDDNDSIFENDNDSLLKTDDDLIFEDDNDLIFEDDNDSLLEYDSLSDNEYD